MLRLWTEKKETAEQLTQAPVKGWWEVSVRAGSRECTFDCWGSRFNTILRFHWRLFPTLYLHMKVGLSWQSHESKSWLKDPVQARTCVLNKTIVNMNSYLHKVYIHFIMRAPDAKLIEHQIRKLFVMQVSKHFFLATFILKSVLALHPQP